MWLSVAARGMSYTSVSVGEVASVLHLGYKVHANRGPERRLQHKVVAACNK